jgi:hypothetical protein
MENNGRKKKQGIWEEDDNTEKVVDKGNMRRKKSEI